MPRVFPDLALPDSLPEKPPGTAAETYEIRVVTPLFGGGFEPGENDASMLIRPTSIRGHLRFWWRAIRGAAFGSAAEMRKAENAIWGATDKASPISVCVQMTRNGNSQPCAEFPANKNFPAFRSNHPGYVLFPFQGKKSQGAITENPRSGTVEIQFTLKVFVRSESVSVDSRRYDLAVELEAAIWAWVNFGGIGARTRRGCGTLFCEQLAPPNADGIAAWFKEKLDRYGIVESSPPKDWPTLPSKLLFQPKPADPLSAWASSISPLREFRQGKIGRNEGPGRSFWPEPDAIRNITGSTLPEHQTPFPGPLNVAFPRAEFGLPIIFKFKNDREGQDPKQTELLPVVNGEKKTRMGSPLILKPLVLQDGKAVPCAMLLDTKPVDKVALEKSGSGKSFPVRSGNLQYDRSPLKKRSPDGSALEGFLSFLKENQFSEVSQ